MPARADPRPPRRDAAQALETEDEESPGDVLMRLAGVERVILGSDGRPYAVVSENGRVECCELRSKAFRHRLVRASLMATRKLPGPEAISAVVGALEAKGEFDGELADVFLRVARAGRDRRISSTSPVARDASLRSGPTVGNPLRDRRCSFAGPAGSSRCRCRRVMARSSF